MRLLVSVACADEAAEAASGGAHIIDAKDPSAGALGAVRLESFRAIREAVPDDAVLSAALGDAAGLAETGRLAEEFASMDRSDWRRSNSAHERKLSTEDESRFGPFTAKVIAALNSGTFLNFLERLTGIGGLIADPFLRGGGLHEIERGGNLGVHADFNFYERLKVYRRLNLLVYLNSSWQEAWGGQLELWTADCRTKAKSIGPVFNRAVIFDTSNKSYHGHPHPLACPEGESRKSIALYYYTTEYPYQEDLAPHSTLFVTPASE